MNKPTKVIDLFAGPGGLGEGFSAYQEKGKKTFSIAISIEKEASAHRTLLLRALFRQFTPKDVPEAYYAFLKGELGENPEDQLYKRAELQTALKQARLEAQQLALGEDSARTVYGKIRDVLGKEECILIGGPPCQAYSVVGRSRNYGAKDKKYSATDDHRNFLYLEYLKIIAKFQPKVFVMENVKGILSAKVNGQLIFESIMKDLKDPFKSTNVEPDSGRTKHQYRIYSFIENKGTLDLIESDEHKIDPKDFIIRAENYGIPQARHRVILLGIRNDVVAKLNNFKRLVPSSSQPTIRQTISDLPQLRSKLSRGNDSTQNWRQAIKDINSNTLNLIKQDTNVSDQIYNNFMSHLNKILSSPASIGADKGVFRKNTEFHKDLPHALKAWYHDKRLGNYIVNHESRGHMKGDLQRYLYYSAYASIMHKSPTAQNLPPALWPQHKNFSSGKFSDRFRVQLANSPGTTVTCHISKDGHYFIHYNPRQCRSLTVREVARIQTFPDNYYFVGNRTQQYVQVGNAVPPYLAYQLADIVRGIIK